MDSNRATEIKLLKGCISGDKAQWDIFVEKYNQLIYHAIFKTLRQYTGGGDHTEDVNDLFQEVFTALCADTCKKLRAFDPDKGCSLPSWLRMITVRITIDHLRKSRPETSLDAVTTSPSQDGIEGEMIGEESRSTLKKLLENLPSQDKLLMELSCIQELPSQETARILNITIENLYTRKNRILGKLKKIALREESLCNK